MLTGADTLRLILERCITTELSCLEVTCWLCSEKFELVFPIGMKVRGPCDTILAPVAGCTDV